MVYIATTNPTPAAATGISEDQHQSLSTFKDWVDSKRGEVVFGVLGCPNLDRDGAPGSLFVASRANGAHMLDLWDDGDDSRRPIRVANISSPAEGRFCESVESGHSDQDESAQIANRLGITLEPFRIEYQAAQSDSAGRLDLFAGYG